jgi:hypothetical protein
MKSGFVRVPVEYLEKNFGVGPNASRAASALAGLYELEQKPFLSSTTTKISFEATRHPTTRALHAPWTRTKATNTWSWPCTAVLCQFLQCVESYLRHNDKERSRDMAPLVFKFCTRRRRVVGCIPRRLRPWYTLDVGPVGCQTQSGRYAEEKHLSPSWEPEFISPGVSCRSTALTATEPSHIQLLCPTGWHVGRDLAPSGRDE